MRLQIDIRCSKPEWIGGTEALVQYYEHLSYWMIGATATMLPQPFLSTILLEDVYTPD